MSLFYKLPYKEIEVKEAVAFLKNQVRESKNLSRIKYAMKELEVAEDVGSIPVLYYLTKIYRDLEIDPAFSIIHTRFYSMLLGELKLVDYMIPKDRYLLLAGHVFQIMLGKKDLERVREYARAHRWKEVTLDDQYDLIFSFQPMLDNIYQIAKLSGEKNMAALPLENDIVEMTADASYLGYDVTQMYDPSGMVGIYNSEWMRNFFEQYADGTWDNLVTLVALMKCRYDNFDSMMRKLWQSDKIYPITTLVATTEDLYYKILEGGLSPNHAAFLAKEISSHSPIRLRKEDIIVDYEKSPVDIEMLNSLRYAPGLLYAGQLAKKIYYMLFLLATDTKAYFQVLLNQTKNAHIFLEGTVLQIQEIAKSEERSEWELWNQYVLLKRISPDIKIDGEENGEALEEAFLGIPAREDCEKEIRKRLAKLPGEASAENIPCYHIRDKQLHPLTDSEQSVVEHVRDYYCKIPYYVIRYGHDSLIVLTLTDKEDWDHEWKVMNELHVVPDEAVYGFVNGKESDMFQVVVMQKEGMLPQIEVLDARRRKKG